MGPSDHPVLVRQSRILWLRSLRSSLAGRRASPFASVRPDFGLMILVLSGALSAAACTSFFGPTPAQVQQRYVERTRPVPLDTTERWTGPIRKLRVEVYADEGHQKGVLGWQVRFYQLVGRVNPVLRAAVGVELEIVSLEPWARQTEVGGLPSALSDLMKRDAGTDADIVIGLITPLSVFTKAQIDLGRANLLGRHLVMRPGDDLAAYDTLDKRLDKVDRDEREALYNALRKRREELVLLHEVGHLLGALHVVDDTRIMAPTADRGVTGFSPENVRLMQIVLKVRETGAGASVAELADTYREALLTAPEGVFDPEGRARMVALLERGPEVVTRATQSDLHPPQTGDQRRLAEDDATVVTRAAELASESPEAAWALFEPVLKRHPEEPSYQVMACELGLRRDPKAEASIAACDRAIELAPNDPRPRLLRAAGHHARGATEAGIEDARAVHDLLTRSSTVSAELWAALARVYRDLSAVSWAVQAAERSGDESLRTDIERWADKTRRVYGLPDDAADRGVPPSEEPAYLKLRGRLAAAAGARDVEAQREWAAKIRRRYPKMSVPPAGCRTLIDQRRWSRAFRVCRAAAQASPRSPDAQTLAGVAAFGVGRPAAAIVPLRRAIALAPDRVATWSLLASAYRASGKRAALKALRAKYEERFGQPLR